MYQVIIVEDDPMVAEIDKQYVEHNNKMVIAGVTRTARMPWNSAGTILWT